MTLQKIKVLYISGWGRSGSTIIGNVLGQLDGFCSVGELRYIWDRGLIENKLCGCGQPFCDCKVWSDILKEAFGDKKNIDPMKLLGLRESLCRTRHIPSMITGNKNRATKGKQLREFIDVLTSLYTAISQVNKCNVIVDSSKWPSYGYIVGMIPTIELYVLHLVRDPRAVAYSWMRTKDLERSTKGIVEMPKLNLLTSTAFWITWNFATERFWKKESSKYLLVRYEDFVKEPLRTINNILEFLDEKRPHLPFIDKSKVMLQQIHTVSGNPSRFKMGEVYIKDDNEWQVQMTHFQKAVIKFLTILFLNKYKYQ